jgi:hypothetical protein
MRPPLFRARKVPGTMIQSKHGDAVMQHGRCKDPTPLVSRWCSLMGGHRYRVQGNCDATPIVAYSLSIVLQQASNFQGAFHARKNDRFTVGSKIQTGADRLSPWPTKEFVKPPFSVPILCISLPSYPCVIPGLCSMIVLHNLLRH